MYLQERPPVTNLYSSAIFIGWGAVIVALILERIFRDGIGAACAGAIGFVTLIIAHHLAGSGDTLEMLQAVLDTNMWLATHVVAITTGFSAMFLAGMLAIIYVVRGVFTTSLKKRSEEHTSELQSPDHLVCRLLLEKKKKNSNHHHDELETTISAQSDRHMAGDERSTPDR